jgi:NAD(P)-dependent dehydrogenase (short-subunit alcohol dehydrogenase family)/drug/metabolite transporter (DMT)-like permease
MRVALSPALRGDAVLLGATAIAGVNISLIALMLRAFDPIALSVIRTGIGAVVLGLVTLVSERRMRIAARDLPLLLASGGFTLLGQISFSYSLTIVNSATFSLLTATAPLFVVILLAALGRHGLSLRHLVAVAVGFIGVTLIITYGQTFSARNLLGDLEGLITAVGYAAFILVLRPLTSRYPTAAVLAYSFAISSVGSAVLGIGQLSTQKWHSVPWNDWIELVGSVVFSVVIANALYVAGLKLLGPVRASMYSYLEPIFGVGAAWLVLAVRLSPVEAAGGLIVIVSLVIEPSRSRAAGQYGKSSRNRKEQLSNMTNPRKTALVTGAADGIGRGVAVALAADGWDLALVGRSRPALQALCRELAGHSVRVTAIPADVRKPPEIARAVTEAERRLGPLDALVNNAGVQRLAPALDFTEEDWDDVLDTNLKGAFFCSQAAGRVMVPRRRGVIVNVGSVAGEVASPDRVAYSASKAGLAMVTRSLALEWAPYSIRVNAIAPTFVDTRLGRLSLDLPGMREQITGRIPLGRIAEMSDVVAAVRFLINPAESGFITGHVLTIDGGLSVQ